MRNLNATYIVTDVTDRVILYVTSVLESAIFVQRHVLDVKISSVPTLRWAKDMAPNLLKGEFNKLIDLQTVGAAVDPEPSDVTKEKWRRASLLGEGYQFLLWYANLATEQYWATTSIDYGDLADYDMNPPRFIEAFAAAKKLTFEAASKQLQFDRDNLATNAVRRKQILWQYEADLLLVDDKAALQQFKNAVKSGVVEVGFV